MVVIDLNHKYPNDSNVAFFTIKFINIYASDFIIQHS